MNEISELNEPLPVTNETPINGNYSSLEEIFPTFPTNNGSTDDPRGSRSSEQNENDILLNVSEVENEFALQSAMMCDKISEHVHGCATCQRRLSFDPVEKALLKTHSVKNEVMELVAFLTAGLFIIVVLYMLLKWKR